MTSSDAAAYAFEQLETSGLVRSRLSGVQLASDGADDPERQRENAVRAASQEGRAEGLATGREEVRAALAALATARAGLDALREEVIERTERAAVELALGLAEQIVAGALEVAPERVLEVVRGGLRRLADRRQITIVLNPDDVATIGDGLDDLRAQLGGIDQAALQADRRVARGGALLRTSDGVLDLQVASQLERARGIVAEELAT